MAQNYVYNGRFNGVLKIDVESLRLLLSHIDWCYAFADVLDIDEC